jgi:hypothetical protein
MKQMCTGSRVFRVEPWAQACLLSLFLLVPSFVHGAEPNWAQLEKRAIEFLQQYLRIRSVNPPADTRETAALIKTELERNGLTPKLYESGPTGQTNLVVRLPGRDASKKPLLLLNHMDVVPVDEKAWNVGPFDGVIRDGQIWGRGALDMKGLAVQQLMALIALHKAGITPLSRHRDDSDCRRGDWRPARNPVDDGQPLRRHRC